MTKFSKNLTNKYIVIRLLKINTIAISTKIATEKSRPFYQKLTRGRNFSANQKISIDRNEPIGNQEEAKKFAFCVFSGNSLQYFRGGLKKSVKNKYVVIYAKKCIQTKNSWNQRHNLRRRNYEFPNLMAKWNQRPFLP